MHDIHFSPAEAARRLGVSPKALRLYERHGLVAPIRQWLARLRAGRDGASASGLGAQGARAVFVQDRRPAGRTAWFSGCHPGTAGTRPGPRSLPAGPCFGADQGGTGPEFTGGDQAFLGKLRNVWNDAFADPKLAPKLPMTPELMGFVTQATAKLKEAE